MIDITNSSIDTRLVDAPVAPEYQLNETRKSGDSTQRNFYQRPKGGSSRRSRATNSGPAVIVKISSRARNHPEPEVKKEVFCYNIFGRPVYMDVDPYE